MVIAEAVLTPLSICCFNMRVCFYLCTRLIFSFGFCDEICQLFGRKQNMLADFSENQGQLSLEILIMPILGIFPIGSDG